MDDKSAGRPLILSSQMEMFKLDKKTRKRGLEEILLNPCLMLIQSLVQVLL